jgi:hypothetical protein
LEFFTSRAVMLIFSYNFIIILIYLSWVSGIEISKIQNARIINSTSAFESDCSTCICQCLSFISSSSSLCCYVNCYIKNNTCQIILSSSTINSLLIIDQTSIVYTTNCSSSLATTQSHTKNLSTSTISATHATTVSTSTPLGSVQHVKENNTV